MKFNIETARYSYKKQIPNTKSEQKSTWKKENPTFSSCPRCHEPIMPHRVCKNCGYYDGKEVVSTNSKKSK